MTFIMLEPDGATTTYTVGANLVKDATGKYRVDWPIAKVGRHAWRFKGSGTGPNTAEEDEFYARRQEAK